jgi:DedD protein
VIERTRHRVTGGIFLVALGFILLPMLFDGSGLAPDYLPPVTELSESAIEPQTSERQVVAPAIISEAAAMRDAVGDDGFMPATGSRIGEPVLRQDHQPARTGVDETPVQERAWAVQLASFSDRANAIALRDRLRADGYQAILSDARQGAVSSTRVAIGPIVSREDALELLHELSDRYQVAPIVVAFSP